MGNARWYLPLRDELPTCQHYTYLNTGTAGPIPSRSAEAAAEEARFELAEGRGNFSTWGRFFAQLEEARALAARLLGADPDEVALTHHTSEGINIVLWGLALQAGDEVVTTTLEHDALCVPLGLLRERKGIRLRFADVGNGSPREVMEGLRGAINDKTRLVALSHIVYSSGALLPVKGIAELAHGVGAKLLVDGAQTCGVLPLCMRDLGADYYTLSGQKWPMGPEGTGALYLRKASMDAVEPTFSGYFSAEKHDFRGTVTLKPTARRFETGMVHRPSWAAFAASARWLLDDVGLQRAWQRSLELANTARQRLSALQGVQIVTPEDAASPLLSFDLPSYSPAQLFALTLELAKTKRIILRSTPHAPFCLRAAFGFFNTEEEIELLVAAIGQAIAEGPGNLVIEGYAAGLPSSR